MTAAQFIARIRRPTRRLVAGWTGIYQYTIDQVLEDMIARCRELKLRLAVPEDQARQEFAVLLTVQAMNYLHSGGHRVFLLMKKLRILALVHDHLVPPEDTTGIDVLEAEWKMEYDVIETLREMGHEVRVLGVHDELGVIRPTAGLFKPHIVFNLMEAFAGVTTFDQNVVSYLELLRLPYTGCNPRGLILARDKALSKKLLAYHRIPVPDFTVVRRGRKPRCRRSCTSRSS